MRRVRRVTSALVAALLLAAGACGGSSSHQTSAAATVSYAALPPESASLTSPGIHHYEYVFPDQQMDVYDIDHRHRLAEHVALPGIRGIRGVVASPQTQLLYISHGGDGGPNGDGSLLAYDLVTGTILWDRAYSRGIDSMAINAVGRRIYMPDGELASDGIWTVLDARSGQPIGAISAGAGKTIVG